jgi:N-acyl-D-aspartate/D-glutamate deacylase
MHRTALVHGCADRGWREQLAPWRGKTAARWLPRASCRLGLTRRGRIAPGFAADLVVFDPDIIADTATFEAPHSYPTGVSHVAVNGVLAVENGAFTGQTPGKVIRDFRD